MNNQPQKVNNGSWERLHEVILHSGMSINAFAAHIGLKRGGNIYQIKRGNNGISKDVAQRVCAKFPNVQKLWLLTGEGPAFDDAQKLEAVPPPTNQPAKMEVSARRFMAACGVLPVLISKDVADPINAAIKYADDLLAMLEASK